MDSICNFKAITEGNNSTPESFNYFRITFIWIRSLPAVIVDKGMRSARYAHQNAFRRFSVHVLLYFEMPI